MKFMNKIYAATCQDADGIYTISLHKSREGAEKAIELDKEKTKNDYMEWFKEESQEFKNSWNEDMAWSVVETNLLD